MCHGLAPARGMDGNHVQVPGPVSHPLRRVVRNAHRPAIVISDPQVFRAELADEGVGEHLSEGLGFTGRGDAGGDSQSEHGVGVVRRGRSNHDAGLRDR